MKLLVNSVLAGLLMGLILILLCCMTGCSHRLRISKTTSTHTAVLRTDSVQNKLLERVSEQTSTDTQREVKDTAIGIASANVSHQGSSDTVIRKGHITLRTYTDSKGTRHTECLADSLTLVIRGLVRERETIARSRDSAVAMFSYQSSRSNEKTTTLTEVVQQQNRGFVFVLKQVLYMLLAVLAGMVIQKWIVPFIKLLSDHHGRIW